MKFTCNTEKMSSALSIVTRAMASKPVKEVYGFVHITTGSKTILLTCTDGTIFMSATVDADILDQGTCALDGKLMTEFMRRLPRGEMTFSIAGNKALLQAGSSKVTIMIGNASDFPKSPAMKPESFTFALKQSDLREAIDFVSYAIAKGDSRPILCGILLEVSTREMKTVAIDGYQMALASAECDYNDEPVKIVIPQKSALELANTLNREDGETVTLVTDKQRLYAKCGKIELNTLLQAGEYIDYACLMPAAFKTSATLSGEEMRNSVERSQIMARASGINLITVDVNEPVVVASQCATGSVDESLSAHIQGCPVQIAFNGIYLQNAIRDVADDMVMKCNGPLEPVIFTSVGSRKISLLLPVRTQSLHKSE